MAYLSTLRKTKESTSSTTGPAVAFFAKFERASRPRSNSASDSCTKIDSARCGVRIMLGGRNEHEERKGPKFTAHLLGLETAAEVDVLWEKVKDRAEVIYNSR